MNLASRKVVLGVDEAGYGPNIGPLTIAASIWRMPQAVTESELGENFGQVFKPLRWSENCGHVPFGDSKKLYRPGGGLGSLEAGLLSAMNVSGKVPTHLYALLDQVGSLSPGHESFASQLAADAPWYHGLEQIVIPASCESAHDIGRLTSVASTAFAEMDVELLGIKAVVISERSFNEQLKVTGSKGQILSLATLGLVQRALGGLEGLDEPAEVYCDRQGGRKNYIPVLLDAMPDEWFTEIKATNQRSSYINRQSPARTIHFSVQGDSFPPTALASMLAKYLRERLMDSVNAYWRGHIEGIKPTAGYPTDAKRFRAAIDSKASQLQLDESVWWRMK